MEMLDGAFEWLLVSQDANLEWGYRSVPQAQLDNRVIELGRAKALGGCGVHNAMVYVRGGKYGFDEWAHNGCAGWDYQSVLPYFKWVESKVHVTTASGDPFISDLVRACQNLGIPCGQGGRSRPGRLLSSASRHEEDES